MSSPFPTATGSTARKVIDSLATAAPGDGHPVLDLSPQAHDRALACVHCGFCLPVCPTYTQNGSEADSPRGRIYLMRQLSQGQIDLTAPVLNHLDLCLDCRACENACPSGVVYHQLLEEARTRLAPKQPQSLIDRLLAIVFFRVFPYPHRLKLALLPVRILQKLRLWPIVSALTPLPGPLAQMRRLLTDSGPLWPTNLAGRYTATHQPQGARPLVGFFAGCVGSVMFQDVNRQAIALLQHAGCDVRVPPDQNCCGAIHHHGAKPHDAQAMARRNIDAFLPADGQAVRWIVTDIAGCGAMLKEYGHLLKDDPAYAARAVEFVRRVRDISQVLVERTSDSPIASPPYPLNWTVTYHDACHLAQAQKVTSEPRQMLSWIKGLRIVPLPESEICCGAAGTYNIAQPEMAAELGERKIRNIQSTGAPIVAMGNVGCAMQVQAQAKRLSVPIQVMHPVTLLYLATFPPSTPSPPSTPCHPGTTSSASSSDLA